MTKKEAIVGTIVCLNGAYAITKGLEFIVTANDPNNERVKVVWHKGYEEPINFPAYQHERLFLPSNIEKLGVITIEEMLTHSNPICRKIALELLHI